MKDQYGEVKNNIFIFAKCYGHDPRDRIVRVHNTHNLFTTFTIENNLFYTTWHNPNHPDIDYSIPAWTTFPNQDGETNHSDNIEGLGYDNRWAAHQSMDSITMWVNWRTLDLRLAEGCAAIHAGQSLYPLVTHDFNGNPYNYVAPSLGAFEYSDNPGPLSAPLLSILPAPTPAR